MKVFLKRAISLVLSAMLIISIVPGAFAAMLNDRYIAGQGLYVMDFETGKELYSQNASQSYDPASMTKLMSVYIVYDAIQNGEISMDTVVPISPYVMSLTKDEDYKDDIELSYLETYYVSELLEIIMVRSANAGTMALAELVAGSEDAFVSRMNKKAKELNLTAKYTGCIGIKKNYISPYSVAALSMSLLKQYPQVLEHSKKSSAYFHGNTYKATNKLLYSYFYQGADGLKTGTTTEAGYCFTATAVRNGVRLIAVVMKSTSDSQRFSDAAALLDYGFSIRDEVVGKTETVPPFTDVFKGDWYAQDVKSAAEKGLMKGTSENSFEPLTEMSRSMSLEVLYRLSESPEVSYSDIFSDVPEGQWYTKSAIWSGENGMLNQMKPLNELDEKGSRKLGVYDIISRQELAQLFYNYAKYLGEDVSERENLNRFSDCKELTESQLEPFSWAVSKGLINGTSPQTISPTESVTRAQYAAILNRFTELF